MIFDCLLHFITSSAFSNHAFHSTLRKCFHIWIHSTRSCWSTRTNHLSTSCRCRSNIINRCTMKIKWQRFMIFNHFYKFFVCSITCSINRSIQQYRISCMQISNIFFLQWQLNCFHEITFFACLHTWQQIFTATGSPAICVGACLI